GGTASASPGWARGSSTTCSSTPKCRAKPAPRPPCSPRAARSCGRPASPGAHAPRSAPARRASSRACSRPSNESNAIRPLPLGGPCVTIATASFPCAEARLNTIPRNFGLWLLLLLMGLLLWSIVTKQQPREPEVSYSRFIEAVDEGRVSEVTIQGKNIRGRYRGDHGEPGEGFKTFSPDDPDLVKLLREKNVTIDARPEDAEPWYFVALVQWAPMLLLVGVWIFFMRQMQVGGGKAMSFGKSRAKLLSENTHKVTFNDVAGIDEGKQTLNQLLVEMDGFETNEGVILIAATNRPDVLDPALLRPGRFDRRVVVPRPDVKGREGILRVHTRRVPIAENVNVELLARQTPGFAGADLENLVNEAALLAARKNKDRVDMVDFELAKDKVMMGAERKSMIISLEERRNTAYHESGHALVAKLLPGGDPVD